HQRRRGAEDPCGGGRAPAPPCEDDARGCRHGGRARQGRSAGLVAILVDQDTKLVVQGLTGREGSFHGLRNREYGTDLVAGVPPGKGGQDVEGVPIFNTVHAAVSETGANTAMVLVPPPFAADAIYESADE